MAKEYRLSPEKFQELTDELNYLKTTREKEVAELIKEARSFGDLSENSEYDEAKNEQGKLYSHIAELEEMLENCVVVEEEENDGNFVHMGNKVTVHDYDWDEDIVYELCGSTEADLASGKLSEECPLGKALLGKTVGEEVEVTALDGTFKYKVLAIEK